MSHDPATGRLAAEGTEGTGGTGVGGEVRATVGPGAPATQELVEWVGTREDGAVVTFLGTVRRRNRGRDVEHLTYEAYDEMASEELRRIADEARERFGVHRVAAHHRTGELPPGEVSVAVAVSAAHRGACYDASRYVMEELKARLPIWKRETYRDGTSEWLDGHSP